MDEQLVSAIRDMQTLHDGGPLYLHVDPEHARLMDREVRRRELHLTVIAQPYLYGGRFELSPLREYRALPA